MSLPTLESLGDSVYGPFVFRLEPQRVGDYVAATFDDSRRWEVHAPPSYAGAALFVVARHLLSSPLLVGRSAIHGDQGFAWHGPIPVGAEATVSGRVSRLRERGGVWFVGFEFEMVGTDGPLVTGSSTFLVSPAAQPERAPSPEPALDDRGENTPLEELGPPVVGTALPVLRRSASRMDLVAYAAASGDLNPIHWDHQTAVEAGLPGVVVHGLLQSAWLCQAAGRHTAGPWPLDSARFRYRAPLRPGSQASVTGRATSDSGLLLDLEATGMIAVAGAFGIRPG